MVSALSMLEEGQAIQNIALNVGYSSASAFIYSFRQEFGVTPQQYFWRKQTYTA
jgi:AraC-like DNA-binding protein